MGVFFMLVKSFLLATFGIKRFKGLYKKLEP